MQRRMFKTIITLVALSVCHFAFAQVPDFVKLSEKASPSVVNISTTRTIKGGQGPAFRFGGPNSDQFNEMFERFMGPGFQMPDFSAESLGSGFFVTEDGYILTNFHVVHRADVIKVGVTSGDEYEAEVVGTDPTSDLALLKIDIEGPTPYLEFGDSGNLKVGQWVMAIGSPFGFDYSVTQGIISAIGRGLYSDKYVPFIQTDVAINPGSSGGPLLDYDGKVIGINSQIVSRSGGYLGLSFAIPSDVAKDVIKQLKDSGKVMRGYLGISFQNVDKALAESFGLKSAKGALVAQIMPESPASAAGFKEGDVIVTFNGKEVEAATDLPHMVGFTRPGEKVKVGIIRDNKPKTLTVEVGELESGADIETEEKSTTDPTNMLGMDVRELTDEEKNQSELDSGMLVTKVTQDSPAAAAGIRAGDVILTLNRKPLTDKLSFDEILKGIKAGDTVPVLMTRRGAGQRYLALRIPK